MLVISAYKFFELARPEFWKSSVTDFAEKQNLLGTILLSREGINLSLGGSSESLTAFKEFIHQAFEIEPLDYKEQPCSFQPFKRLSVQIRDELIAMGIPEIQPHQFTAPTISPEKFKTWLEEQRDFTLLDTRNDYEIGFGKFQNAIDLQVKTFKEFAQKSTELPEEMKQKPLVMYCTGGIRCEKASALFAQELGFKDVYQLEGGILNYFKEVGGDHFEGECLVFDNRVGVKANRELNETDRCYTCHETLGQEDRQSSKYKPFISCPHCVETL